MENYKSLIKGSLSNKGLTLHKPINSKEFKQILKDLKLIYKVKISKYASRSKFLNCYQIQENGIVVPRYYGIMKAEKVNINFNSIQPLNFNSSIKLDNNQTVVFDHIMNNYFTMDKVQKGLGICLLQMDTGLGKSYLASAIVEKLSVRTCIIAPRGPIMKEWKAIFNKYFKSYANNSSSFPTSTSKDVNVSFCVGKQNLVNDIVIMSFKTAYTKGYEFYKNFDFVIIDEIHMVATEKFKNILFNSNVPFVLGMTATPNERIDSFDKFYHLYLGKPLIAESIPGFNKDSIVFTGKVVAIDYYGDNKYTETQKNNDGSTCTMNCIQLLEKDEKRNRLILGNLVELYKNGYNTFIFAENVDFLKYLYETFTSYLPTIYKERIIKEQEVLKSKPISESQSLSKTNNQTITYQKQDPFSNNYGVYLMTGGNDIYEEIKLNSKFVFTTYGYSSEGISFPHMNSILFATPRRNKMNQILGRITRRGGNNEIERIIVDIIDVKTIFKKQFSTRKSIYSLKNYKIVKLEVC